MSAPDFTSLALSAELKAVIHELGFGELTPIQAQAIPLLLEGKDLIGQSQTGSGKTAAFALPILQKINLEQQSLQALILCPTRELGAQVVSEIRKLGRKLSGLKVLALAGGQPGRPQADALAQGVHIVVGTPGRVLDFLERGRIHFEDVHFAILDEADKMLDMGFEQEVTSIMGALPIRRQTAFFSATFPSSIQALSRKYQKDPVTIKIGETETSAPQIEQIVYEIDDDNKLHTLMRVLQQHPSQSTVVFCNQKLTVAEIGELLAEQNVSCAALHGDLEQRERDRVMALFRNGTHRILIATDVAARGLDIESLELVINYDLPVTPEVYVHRIGRTGRAGRSGTAVVLAKPSEALRVHEIEKFAGIKLEKKSLGFKNQHGLGGRFLSAPMQTVSISGGRKDKLRPGDILGALTSAPNPVPASEIGKIEILDRISYVAISSAWVDKALEKLRTGKIKGSKFPVRRA